MNQVVKGALIKVNYRFYRVMEIQEKQLKLFLMANIQGTKEYTQISDAYITMSIEDYQKHNGQVVGMLHEN